MATYLTQEQDSLLDVSYNTIGSLYAIDNIMNTNNLNDYSVSFPYGQSLIVNGLIQNNAAILKARVRAFNSSFISEGMVNSLINDFINTIKNI